MRANQNVLELDEPVGWRRLHEKAQQATNPKRLALIIDQMNRLLDEHEKMVERRDAQRHDQDSSATSM
jgi:23S rRNA maturation mini-RNase III